MHKLYITTKILICQEKISFFIKINGIIKTKKNKKEKEPFPLAKREVINIDEQK